MINSEKDVNKDSKNSSIPSLEITRVRNLSIKIEQTSVFLPKKVDLSPSAIKILKF